MVDDKQLADVLSEFARTMVTDFRIADILDHLVKRIVGILPITAAGVTLMSPGADPSHVAASNNAALRFERLQTEVGEGPCMLTYTTDAPVAVADLTADDRFPTFGPRAVDAGLAAMFTFPLRHGGRRLGALDLYRDRPGPLTAWAMDAAQTLADVAAAYLVNAQTRADLQDASDRSRAASLHDGLTGLPNRILLLDRITHALRRSSRSGLISAVLFLDLDRFKTVNDAHGHATGDELLITVAHRLSALLRPGDTVARLSGDEFVVVCEDLDTPAHAGLIAERLCAALADPFDLTPAQVRITASVGVAFADPEHHDPDQILHAADTAMYAVKRGGGGRWQVYDPYPPHATDHQVSLPHDLRQAIRRGQLHTEYQPIVSSADGRITGCEALLRWRHPQRGLVPPMVLIPLAEQAGLITEIGSWVLRQAWADQSRWQHTQTDNALGMAVNVSPHQLMSTGFTNAVADVLAADTVDPAQLTLEMTESVFINDTDNALAVLTDLKNLGVRVALDDFGTGYSPLSYLLKFPVDIIKIDRSFITNLGRDTTSHLIISAIVQLAHGLGMTVIAEGVENAHQHHAITELGCDSCQGYYFAHPMPAQDLDTLLHHGTHGHHPRLPVPAANL